MPSSIVVPDPQIMGNSPSAIGLALNQVAQAALNDIGGLDTTASFTASTTTLAAITAANRSDGMLVLVTADGSLWRFSAASSATDTTNTMAVAPGAGSGAWLRVDKSFDLKVPIAFGTANAAVLFTVPTGFKIRINKAFWEVTTGFTGGTSSAIGVDSSNTHYNTAGDILGGSGGDVAATLVAGYVAGTIETKYGSNGIVVLVAGDTLVFNRIASAFTAGAGFVHAAVEVIN